MLPLLQAGLSALQFDLPPVQQEQLLRYLAFLQKWNKTFSITAIRKPEEMLSLHLLDSLSILPHLSGEHFLDVGSGGGMPGLVLAIARPDWAWTLADSNQKKTSFLRQAAIELGLKNVTVWCTRIEQVQPPPFFDCITSRAFSELSDFVQLTQHLLAKDGYWAAMKGVHPVEEIARLPEGVQVIESLPLHVPNVEGERHLVKLSVSCNSSA